MKQQEQGEEEVEVEEDEYEEEQTDIIREAATLDDMAKLITVEEVHTSSCFFCCFFLWMSKAEEPTYVTLCN